MTTDGKRVPAGAAVLRGEITAAIRRAVLHELAAVGYGRLSIEAVARRAGVGKTAVYRRWGSKLDMVREIVADVADHRLPLPDSGSLTGDIELLLQVAAQALKHPLASQIIPDLLAEAVRTPQLGQTLRAVLQARQRDVASVLVDRAVARGELPTGVDPDSVVDLVVGPLYWRVAIARTPLAAEELPRLAAAGAAAVRVRSAPPPQGAPAPRAAPDSSPTTTD